MDFSFLPRDETKDISLSQKEKTKKNTSNNKRSVERYIEKSAKSTSFTKNQRKKINSGNKSKLAKIKRNYPELFKCSVCAFATKTSEDVTTWCNYYKHPVVNEYHEAHSCDKIIV